MCYFHMVSMINVPQPGDLKQLKFILTVQKAGSVKSRYQLGQFLLGALRENLLPTSIPSFC